MEKTYQGRFHETLNLGRMDSLDLHFDKNASGSLALILDDSIEKLDIRLYADEYSYVKIFMDNESHTRTEMNLHADIEKDAKIQFGLLDLTDADCTLKMQADLNKNGATMEYLCGQLVQKDGKKVNDLHIDHHAPYTYGNMHNFAVEFSEAFYDTVAAGKIEKGCFSSESHQETRVLTMGKDHTAKVIPILYIDENDVKASHALTIGQPDENQMYYLCSRGLSRKQAIGLLSIGYFMPVIDLIDDEEQREEIRRKMEEKVGLYGH